MKVIKFEVWHGGEIHDTYDSEKEAIKVARMLDKKLGSVSVYRTTVEKINFK